MSLNCLLLFFYTIFEQYQIKILCNFYHYFLIFKSEKICKTVFPCSYEAQVDFFDPQKMGQKFRDSRFLTSSKQPPTHISVGCDGCEEDALVPQPQPHCLGEEGAGHSSGTVRLQATPRSHDVHLSRQIVNVYQIFFFLFIDDQ